MTAFLAKVLCQGVVQRMVKVVSSMSVQAPAEYCCSFFCNSLVQLFSVLLCYTAIPAAYCSALSTTNL